MSTSMDIYTDPLAKVRYDHPKAGYPLDQKTASEHLTRGAIYTVDSIDVGDWVSNVYLKEFPGVSFNSVLFSNVP